IVFNDVRFTYDKEQVINGISFLAKEGTVTALAGPSGSGKSTLAKLLARFWDVNGGEISLGGEDIRRIPLDQLMDEISYVSQDNYLFDISIRENIRIGKPSATDKEIERAAEQAGCSEFINRFPEGLDTKVGDAGDRLSGGERQRIAIARAMIKDAPVIILDEATAFADPENEDKIQRSIGNLTKGKTLIVIAHRLSTIMYADNILVLEHGEIAAQGTHKELLKSSLLYGNMWRAHLAAMDWSMNKEGDEVCGA
ncbi:MAG: ATP-binding cassette domain-containing protein, partial [Clostridiales bacterium]|nr:ATP-binding cassette domain-containing protein [Clostridiales bacterium]